MKQLLILFIGLNCLTAKHPETPEENMYPLSNPVQTVTDLFIATDRGDWNTLHQLFAPEVRLDYSSMNGQPAQILTPKAISSAWKSILPGFEYTHHQIGNFNSKSTETTAKVFCYGTAQHYLSDPQGSVWTVVGTYDFELQLIHKEWRITSMTFHYKFQTGNSSLIKKHKNMQKLTKISLVASVLLWCYSCQTPQSSSTPPHKATSAAMKIATRNKTTVTNFFTALETKNLEKLVSLFADDAQHINPYHSDIFPRGAIGKEEIASYWKPVFPAINSMRFVIEEMYTLESPTSLFVKFKGAIDFLNTTDVYTNQYYATFTFNSRGEILEYVEIFNPIPAAKAFGLSVATKTSNTMKQQIIPVQFNSEGLRIKGNLFLPKNYEKGKKYPTIISVGSWTTVKEQMAGLYAKRFAEQGFISLAFDFRNFGESEGLPRAWENPNMKIKDIQNAVSFLQTLPEVAADNIGIFGVCAGSMYALMATAETPSIKAVATTASWLHDAEAVTLFYGGEAGVQEKIKAAQRAKKHYAETGDIAYIKAISTTDSTAAMYGEFDYYLNPSRGAVKQWDPNQFALASWEDWLTLDPFPTAAQIQQPVLMIHSDGCVLPDYTKKYFEELQSSDKELLWVPTTLASPMHQFNFYDQEPEVSLAVEKTSKFFHQKLR